jgi:RNA polymerase sigma-70 factor, ECF subfamily
MNKIGFDKFPQTIKELDIFIEKHQNKLVHHAFFRVGIKQEAEDIVQNVIVKMYLEREKFININNSLAYVFKMVSNSCLDYHRKNKKTQIELVDDYSEVLNEQMNDKLPMVIEEEYEKINNILSMIPNEQSEVIRFKILDELSFVEIAKIYEIPVTTVKSRFKYGIEKLKKMILKQKEVKNELRYF